MIIGINVHIRGNSPTIQVFSDVLGELMSGLPPERKLIRINNASIGPNGGTNPQAELVNLVYQEHGIRSLVIASETAVDNGGLVRLVDTYGPAVWGIEGLNESSDVNHAITYQRSLAGQFPKSSYPDLVLVSPSFVRNRACTAFQPNMFDEVVGDRPIADYASTHGYPDFSTGDMGNIQTVFDCAYATKLGGCPILHTEFGVSSRQAAIGEDLQAQNILIAFNQILSDPRVSGAFLFELADEVALADRFAGGSGHMYGILDSSLTQKKRAFYTWYNRIRENLYRRLTWTDPADSASDEIEVLYSDDGVNWVPLDIGQGPVRVPVGVGYFDIPPQHAPQGRLFTVRSVDVDSSTTSDQAPSVQNPDLTPTADPGDLSATALTSAIRLTGTYPADASTCRFYRSDDDTVWELLYVENAPSGSFTLDDDGTLVLPAPQVGVTYKYYAVFFDAAGNPTISSVVSATIVDSTPPTLVQASIESSGTDLTLSFSEAVVSGAGGTGGFVLRVRGITISPSYVSGLGSDTLSYSLPEPIYTGESVMLDYTQPGDGIEDTAGNDLASFASRSVVNNSTLVPPAPQVTAASVNSSGTQLTISFNENVSFGTGGSGGFVLNATNGNPGLTYSSGSGTTSLIYSISRAILSGETLTLDYTQPGDGIENGMGVDLPSFTGQGVTNNSTVTDATPPFLQSASISNDGNTLTLTFDEAVTFGAGGSGGFALTASGGAVSPTYSSGAGTDTILFTLSRAVASSETVTLDYTQPGDGWQDLSGNDLNNIAGFGVSFAGSITLSSAQGTSVSTESVVLDVTTTDRHGKLYWVIYPSSEPTPTAQEIKNGQKSGGSPATDGGFVFHGRKNKISLFVGGLEPGSSYKAAFVQEGLYGSESNVTETPVFSTPSRPGYLVDDTSPAGAFATHRLSSTYVGPALRVAREDIIENVDTLASTFTLTGTEAASVLLPGETLEVVGSTSNDGAYTISSVSVSGQSTVVTVAESIPSSTADGNAYVQRNINFVGDELDTDAIQTFCAGAQGRVSTLYSQTGGPDLVASVLHNAPYIFRRGYIEKDTYGKPVLYFRGNASMSASGLSQVDSQSITVVAGVWNGFPHQNNTLFKIAGIKLASGTSMSLRLAVDNAVTSSVPLSIERPTHVIVRGNGTTVDLYRNRSLDHSKTQVGYTGTSLSMSGSSCNHRLSYLCYYTSALTGASFDAMYERLNAIWYYGPKQDMTSPHPSWGISYRESHELYNYLNRLSVTDVDFTPAPVTWDGGGDWTGREDELAELHVLWDSSHILAQEDIMSESRWYVADDGGPSTTTNHTVLRECTISSTAPDTPGDGILQVVDDGINYKECFITFDIASLVADPAKSILTTYLLSEDSADTGKLVVGIDFYYDLNFDPATATWNNPPVAPKLGYNAYTQGISFVYGQTEAELEDITTELVKAHRAGYSTVTLHMWAASGSNREIALHTTTDPNPPTLVTTYRAGILATGDILIPHFRPDGSHAYGLGTAGAHLYGISLPNSDGSEGNPYYLFPAMGHRALVQGALRQAIHWYNGVDNDQYSAQQEIGMKLIRTTALIYYYCKELLTPEEQEAYIEGMRALLCGYIVKDPSNLCNMGMSGIEGAAWAYKAVPDKAFRELCVRAIKRFLFGDDYGDFSTMEDVYGKRGCFFSAGYVAEGNGPDPNYGGYSLAHMGAVKTLVPEEPDMNFAVQAVDRMSKLKVHAIVPQPDGTGDYSLGAGYAYRTSAGFDSDLGTGPWRGPALAFQSDWAKPLYTPSDIATMTSNINGYISDLNSKAHESAAEGITGYAGSFTPLKPITYGVNSFWPSDVPMAIPASVGWYTTLKSLYDAGDPVYNLPHSYNHNQAIGYPGEVAGPEFWSYSALDSNGQRYSFFVEALHRPFDGNIPKPRFQGWSGGKLEGFWTPNTGVIIETRHNKGGGQGSGDPSYESTRRWAVADLWAACQPLAYARYTAVSVSGNEVRISGNYASLFKSGTGVWLSQSNTNSLGTKTVDTASYDSVSDETVLTFSSLPANFAVGDYVIWGISPLFSAKEDQTVSFNIDAPTPSVTVTSRIGPSYASGAVLAGDSEVTGLVTVANTFEAVQDGIRITHQWDADATAQANDYIPALDAVIPVLVNDPGWGTTLNDDATIEFDDGGWAFATTTAVTTQYIRIGRNGSYVYVILDQPRQVRLSDAEWVNTYQGNQRYRNILVNMHPSPGTPVLFPATSTVTYTISTVDTTGVTGTAMSVQLEDPLSGVILPVGEVSAAHWLVQGGVPPYTHRLMVSTDGGSTYTELPLHTIREISPGEFEGFGDSWPSNLTSLYIEVTDSNGQVKTTVSSSVSSATPTIVLHDTFTGANGEDITTHVPDQGSYTFMPGVGGIVLNGNGQATYMSGSSSRLMLDTGTYYVVVDTKVRRGLDGDNAISNMPRALIRSRESNSGVGIRPFHYGSDIILSQYQGNSVTVPVSSSYVRGDWQRSRTYSTLDYVVTVLYDDMDNVIGYAAMWTLSGPHYGNDRKNFGVDLEKFSNEVDTLTIYTFG